MASPAPTLLLLPVLPWTARRVPPIRKDGTTPIRIKTISAIGNLPRPFISSSVAQQRLPLALRLLDRTAYLDLLPFPTS